MHESIIYYYCKRYGVDNICSLNNQYYREIGLCKAAKSYTVYVNYYWAGGNKI